MAAAKKRYGRLMDGVDAYPTRGGIPGSKGPKRVAMVPVRDYISPADSQALDDQWRSFELDHSTKSRSGD